MVRRVRVHSAARLRRCARLEQLGRGRHDDGVGQAAAGQRPASRGADSVALVPRAPVGGRLRRHRRHAARRACGRHRPQQVHRLGRNQRHGRCAGPVSGTPRSDGHDGRIPGGAGTAGGRQGDDRRQGRRARQLRRTDFPPRPAHLRRHQRHQRRIHACRASGSDRTARLPLDGAGPRGCHHPRVPLREPGAQLDRVHRGAARLRGARAELRVRGRRRAHRVLRARAVSRPRERERRDAGGRMDGRGRMDRLDSLRPVASHIRPAESLTSSRPTRSRRRPSIRTRSPGNGPSHTEPGASSIS